MIVGRDVDAAALRAGSAVVALRACLLGRLEVSGAQPESRRGLVVVGLEGLEGLEDFAALLVRLLIVSGES